MEKQTVNDNRSWAPAIAKGTFLLLTAVLFVTVVYILRSVLHAIILGVLFGMLLLPVHALFLRYVSAVMMRLKHCTGGKSMTEAEQRKLAKCQARSRSLSSLLTLLLVVIVVVVPLLLFGSSMVRQGYDATVSAQSWIVKELPGKVQAAIDKYQLKARLDKLTDIFEQFHTLVPSEVSNSVPSKQADRNGVAGVEWQGRESGTELPPARQTVDFNRDAGPMLSNVAAKVVAFLRDAIMTLLSEIGVLIFNFCIMLFVMYQFLNDGQSMVDYVKSISPLSDDAMRSVETRVKEVSKAVVFGIFGTAVTQGLCAMLCFALADIPVFWGVVLGFCSIVPVVGTSMIWIPVVAYLVLIGAYGKAIFIFLTCGCVIANFDMILRPLLMRRSGETGMSYMVLFLSILGGIQTFGLVGIIYGPLITGICSICLLIFSTQFKAKRELADKSNTQKEQSDDQGSIDTAL